MNLKVIMTPVDAVNPASYNPRAISEEAFKGLVESIRNFGIVRPLVVNSTTGHLVGGHQTLRAAKTLGMTLVPVVHVSVDEAREKALNVTLNNPLISGHYTDGLQDLLEEIKGTLGEGYMAGMHLDDLVVSDDWYDEAKAQATANAVGDYDADNDDFLLKIDGIKPRDKDDVAARVTKALEGTAYVAKVY